MTKLATRDLKPNMMTAAPIFSKSGQLILPEHTLLTTQQILRLNFYGIEHIRVILPEEIQDPAVNELTGSGHEDIISYSQKIRKSEAFQTFKADYNKKVELLEDSLNDILKKNTPIDSNLLISQMSSLYEGNLTTLSIFDMLHNMRQIDDSTYAHSINVALISRMLGEWLSFSPEDLDVLTLAGLLHDIGKCKIDPEIIAKPGPLSDDEFAIIKEHPRLGAEVLEHQDLDKRVKLAALMHHERCDGSGYPLGLFCDEISDFAKIISIADVYDAMTANRCYRKGLCPFEVIATFEREGLSKFDSRYISTFQNHIGDTYISNCVLLNDGTCGKIILMNRQILSRPTVHTSTDEYIDLMKHPELHIQAII